MKCYLHSYCIGNSSYRKRQIERDTELYIGMRLIMPLIGA